MIALLRHACVMTLRFQRDASYIAAGNSGWTWVKLIAVTSGESRKRQQA
jgi:hypothetical protein